jgi:predicted dinucleotide-utilizing enzyme
MKRSLALALLLVFAAASAAEPSTTSAALVAQAASHRYLVERTFPPGALAGLDAATKRKVNANNASVGVRWVESYANADKTKTFCIYEGPSEEAVRKAAELNKLPVDSITEVPVTLSPK